MERNRALQLLPVAVLILVGAAYLWEMVTMAGIPFARDIQMFFIPQKRLLWEAYQAREVPLWTPYIATGAPFHANMQAGFFYPPNWLFAVLPFYVAFNASLILHFVLSGIFAFLLCRRLGASRVASYVGAVGWMLGGYFASLLNLINALQGATWVPALAWAVLRTLQTRSVHSYVWLALVAACAALAGEPQTLLLSLICTLIILGTWIDRERPGLARLRGPVLGWGLAAVVVLGLTLVQALPTLDYLSNSGRGTGLTIEQAAAFDLKPARLLYFIVPTDFRDPEYAFGLRSIIGAGDPWLFSTYLGALFPILAFFAWRGGRRREVATWSIASVLAVLVGLGDHTPVFPWLFENVPGLSSFRFPEKYFLIAAFAVVPLSAYGVDAVLEAKPRRSEAFWAAAYVALPLVLLAIMHLDYEGVRAWALSFGNARMADDYEFAFGIWRENLLKLALILGLTLGLIWAYRAKKVSVGLFGVLIAAIVTADLSVAHRDLNPVVEQAFYEDPPEILRHVPLEEIQRDYRYRSSRFDSLSGTLPVLAGVALEPQKWLWQQIMGPNVGQPWKVLQQDAWDAIKLSRVEDERELHRILEAERRWRMLQIQSVRWVHSIFPLEIEGRAREIPMDTLGGHLYEIERPLPRAYVAANATWVADDVEAINQVLDAAFDIERDVVLSRSAEAPASADTVRAAVDVELSAAAPGASSDAERGSASVEGEATADDMGAAPFDPGATIVESSPHRVRIRLDEGRQGFAVLTDAHYPGWEARVDGEPRPIHLANFFFRGVEVGPGDREVVFTYRSSAYERGRTISLWSAVLGALLWLTLGVVQRRRMEP